MSITVALQRAIFSSANFSSIATDEKGVIQLFNVGAERMLGYSAAEVVNKVTPAELSDPQELMVRAKALSAELSTPITPGFEALVFKASRGIEDIYELTYLCKDGSHVPAIVSVTALRDDEGAIIGYLLINTDNTARKQVEAQERQLAQRLRDHQFYTRSLFESNIDALMTTDPAGIITDVNRQIGELTGCTRDELIGAPMKSYFTDPERAQEGITRVLAEGKLTNFELTVRARNGVETVVSLNATTLYDRDRRLHGVFAAARDITERKRLDQLMIENNLEIESARSAAEKANLAKSEFLAAMSHEIRTPMNGVIGMIDVMQQSSLNEAQMKMAGIIHDSAFSLLGVIDDILDFSKIEAGRLEMESIPMSVAAVVEEIGRNMGRMASRKGGEFSLFLDPALPGKVLGDPGRLRQILVNLTNNAIKFSSGPERVCRVSLHATVLQSDPTQVTLDFSVTDNGIGIDEVTQARLFTAFIQADASTTRNFGGTGLGLVISRRLAQLMNGDISVESEPGQGSQFHLRIAFALPAADPAADGAIDPAALPAALQATSAAGGPPSPSPTAIVPLSRAEAQRRGRLILVAEDNEINQDVILQQLALLGQTADIASNGAEALALWQDGQYGLLISDLHMPRMDGYELTAAIRTAEAGGMRMPILAFTADALRGAAARCLAVGMDDYLAKPVQLVDLEAKLKKWLPGADLAVDVDVLKALIGADPALLREFLQDFRVGANRIAGQLRPACEARDPAAVVALVHKLKSSARSVGALRLGDHCARMEEAGLAGDSDAITALLPGFDSSMARVEEFLAQY